MDWNLVQRGAQPSNLWSTDQLYLSSSGHCLKAADRFILQLCRQFPSGYPYSLSAHKLHTLVRRVIESAESVPHRALFRDLGSEESGATVIWRAENGLPRLLLHGLEQAEVGRSGYAPRAIQLDEGSASPHPCTVRIALDSVQAQTLRHEIDIMQQLSAANVPGIMRVERLPSYEALTFQQYSCDGTALCTVVDGVEQVFDHLEQPPSFKKLHRMALDYFSTLAAMHREGVYHADLGAQSLYRNVDGNYVIGDFHASVSCNSDQMDNADQLQRGDVGALASSLLGFLDEWHTRCDGLTSENRCETQLVRILLSAGQSAGTSGPFAADVLEALKGITVR